MSGGGGGRGQRRGPPPCSWCRLRVEQSACSGGVSQGAPAHPAQLPPHAPPARPPARPQLCAQLGGVHADVPRARARPVCCLKQPRCERRRRPHGARLQRCATRRRAACAEGALPAIKPCRTHRRSPRRSPLARCTSRSTRPAISSTCRWARAVAAAVGRPAALGSRASPGTRHVALTPAPCARALLIAAPPLGQDTLLGFTAAVTLTVHHKLCGRTRMLWSAMSEARRRGARVCLPCLAIFAAAWVFCRRWGGGQRGAWPQGATANAHRPRASRPPCCQARPAAAGACRLRLSSTAPVTAATVATASCSSLAMTHRQRRPSRPRAARMWAWRPGWRQASGPRG